jgi:hypothetical protein
MFVFLAVLYPAPLYFCLAVFFPPPLIPGLAIILIPVKTEYPPAREDAGGFEEVGQGWCSIASVEHCLNPRPSDIYDIIDNAFPYFSTITAPSQCELTTLRKHAVLQHIFGSGWAAAQR